MTFHLQTALIPFLETPMKTPRALLLLGLLTLAACGNESQPTNPPPTTSNTSPTTTVHQALTSYGLYELTLAGLSTEKPSAIVSAAGLHSQTAEVNSLDFTPLSVASHTDEQARIRYVRASFKVKNNSGRALTLPTYVPIDTDGVGGTVGKTPFRQVQYFDGSDASERANDLKLITATQINASGLVETDPNATPLVKGLDTRSLQVSVGQGTSVTRVFDEGWQGATLPAGESQTVTFATSLPMDNDSKKDPFRFNLVFAVTDNPAPLPVDTAAPSVKLTVNPSVLTATGPVTLQAEAQDDVGVQSVQFYEGDTLLGTDTEAPYEWTTTYSAADNGDHTLRAVATDTSGKTAEAQAALKVDIVTTAPDGKLSAKLIRANRSENVVGSTAQLYATGDRSKVLATAQTDESGAVTFEGLAAGTYDLVFSKAGSAGSELMGAAVRPGLNPQYKVAQFDAQNPTALTNVPKLALLTPTSLDADGNAVDWKTLSAGTVMNDAVQVRAYTTAENPNPLQMKYMLFSLVTFDPSGQMMELRNGLFSVDAGRVVPGMDSQDSGQIDLDAAGLSGEIFVQVVGLDFNNNRSAYLVPVKLVRSVTPGAVTAPTGVKAIGYTNSERVNYIYRVGDLTGQSVRPNSNSWVSVSWDMPASTEGLTGFKVLRATAKEGPYTEVAFAGAAQCSASTKRCTVSDNTATLEIGQDYYYRVKAIGATEELSVAPDLPSTRLLPPFAPQLLAPASEGVDVDLLPLYTFKTNAFAGGATGLRFDLRVSDTFTATANADAPSLRLINQNGSFKVTGIDADTRDYGKWVSYDAATDTLKVPHDLTRLRSGLTPTPLQANRRYSWLLHRAYAYRLLDPTQPESVTNPVVSYSVYSDPDTTKIVPGGATQSVSTIHHFITRP